MPACPTTVVADVLSYRQTVIMYSLTGKLTVFDRL